jgi:3-oxoacyl-[acyl-carrier protein] reductase
MIDNQNLKGKIALVTGASRGIGKAISIALAGAGATVVLSARTVEKLKELKAEIEKGGGKAEVLPVDLSKTSDIISLFKDIKDKFGRLDILINNAAIGIFGDMVDLTTEDLDKTFDINVKSIFTASKQALELMIPQKSGYIINISSVQGVKAYKQQSIYAASKHAVMGMSKALAAEVQEHNIRISAILPGGVDTDLISDARPDLDRSILIKPEDIARTVLYLLSLSDRAMVDQVMVRRFTSTPFNA